MKVGRFTIKPRITLEIMGECDIALQAAKSTSIEKDAVMHLKRIVRLLTTSRIVTRWDLRKIDAILKAAGFVGEAKEATPDPDWLLNLTSWLGVHVHKLPYEVAIGSTAKEAAQLAKAIARKIIDDAVRLWRIQHDPEDVIRELTDDLRKLATNETEEIKLMETRGPSGKTMAKMMKEALQA